MARSPCQDEVEPKGSPKVPGAPQLWPQVLNQKESDCCLPSTTHTHQGGSTLAPNVNRQRKMETNCKIYSRAAGAGEILKGTSCFGGCGSLALAGAHITVGRGRD